MKTTPPKGSYIPKDTQEIADIKEAFASWLALPKKKRLPSTQIAFSQKVGIRNATLSNWKNDPKFARRVAEIALLSTAYDLGEALASSLRLLHCGSVEAGEFWATLGGYLKPVTQGSTNLSVSINTTGQPTRSKDEILAEQLELRQLSLHTDKPSNGNGNGNN